MFLIEPKMRPNIYNQFQLRFTKTKAQGQTAIHLQAHPSLNTPADFFPPFHLCVLIFCPFSFCLVYITIISFYILFLSFPLLSFLSSEIFIIPSLNHVSETPRSPLPARPSAQRALPCLLLPTMTESKKQTQQTHEEIQKETQRGLCRHAHHCTLFSEEGTPTCKPVWQIDQSEFLQ